jgi:hypothetical protein
MTPEEKLEAERKKWREYARKNYLTHREARKKLAKEYYITHREARLKYAKEYHTKYKDQRWTAKLQQQLIE